MFSFTVWQEGELFGHPSHTAICESDGVMYGFCIKGGFMVSTIYVDNKAV